MQGLFSRFSTHKPDWGSTRRVTARIVTPLDSITSGVSRARGCPQDGRSVCGG